MDVSECVVVVLVPRRKGVVISSESQEKFSNTYSHFKDLYTPRKVMMVLVGECGGDGEGG